MPRPLGFTLRTVSRSENLAQPVRQHKAAAYWRDRPFPLYEDILTLIEGRTATGDHAIHMPEMYSSSPPPEIAGMTGTQEDELYSDESEGEKASPEIKYPQSALLALSKN
ncbi:hypothetical protein LshimejAT787_2200120 [Lyophyllum shimeji]|uniref:Uncharacterized protein n=1 Tax=Lyophyllum shimeji TaxID=47721 RepID=A0A9P3Q1B2_LYOSH|nr:hypothetical protein LshimejAT787_2200120 [Lyophyllum shimeji]